MDQIAVWRSVRAVVVCAVWMAVDGPTPSAGAELTPGAGFGFGSPYATLGVSGSFGSDYLRAEIAVGTEPFVWSTTYAAGATAMFLDPASRVRPRLSLFLKSNASAVTVWEPEAEGEIQNDVEYEPYAGIAALVGVDVRVGEDERGSSWLSLTAGYRTPFSGMDEVEKKADEFASRYGMTGHDVSLPRWDHFTFSLGVNFLLRQL